jgi:hypothetical protein
MSGAAFFGIRGQSRGAILPLGNYAFQGESRDYGDLLQEHMAARKRIFLGMPFDFGS